jgi:hypothetical protein
MKTKSLVLSIIAGLAVSLPAFAADKKHDPSDHKHEKKVAGPNGGRIIATVTPRAEFFVTADRKVQITFLDQAGKAIAPADQIVTVTTGDRSAPKVLTFAKAGNTLLSTTAFPAGNDLPAVVQIKAGPTGKTITAKFNVDLSKCGECKLAEYACICAH